MAARMSPQEWIDRQAAAAWDREKKSRLATNPGAEPRDRGFTAEARSILYRLLLLHLSPHLHRRSLSEPARDSTMMSESRRRLQSRVLDSLGRYVVVVGRSVHPSKALIRIATVNRWRGWDLMAIPVELPALLASAVHRIDPRSLGAAERARVADLAKDFRLPNGTRCLVGASSEPADLEKGLELLVGMHSRRRMQGEARDQAAAAAMLAGVYVKQPVRRT